MSRQSDPSPRFFSLVRRSTIALAPRQSNQRQLRWRLAAAIATIWAPFTRCDATWSLAGPWLILGPRTPSPVPVPSSGLGHVGADDPSRRPRHGAKSRMWRSLVPSAPLRKPAPCHDPVPIVRMGSHGIAWVCVGVNGILTNSRRACLSFSEDGFIKSEEAFSRCIREAIGPARSRSLLGQTSIVMVAHAAYVVACTICRVATWDDVDLASCGRRTRYVSHSSSGLT